MDKSYAGLHGKLPSRLLHPLKHLQLLTLTKSGIRSLPSNAFHGLRHLQVLTSPLFNHINKYFILLYFRLTMASKANRKMEILTPCLSELDRMIALSTPIIMLIFVEIGPTGSAISLKYNLLVTLCTFSLLCLGRLQPKNDERIFTMFTSNDAS